MNPVIRAARRVSVRVAVSLAMVAASAGCGDDANGPAEPAGYTTAPEVVEAHEAALAERDLDAYVALLEPGFRYYPQVTDLDDFPWMSGSDSWNLDEEINMISNIFDPSFISPENGQSVDNVTAELAIESTESLPDGATGVSCHAVMQVLWAEQDGLRTDVLFEIVLARGSDGYLRIRSIREHPLLLRSGPGASVEADTWASIKSLYR